MYNMKDILLIVYGYSLVHGTLPIVVILWLYSPSSNQPIKYYNDNTYYVAVYVHSSTMVSHISLYLHTLWIV